MTQHDSGNTPRQPLPPAGWYPDESGIQRYWNGNAWTEHTHQQASPQASVEAQPKRPWFKKKRVLIPSGLLLLFIVIGVAGGSSDDTAEPVAAAADEDARPAASGEESSAPRTASPKPRASPKVTAVKVSASQLIKDYQDNELAADDKYKGKTLRVDGVVDKIDTEFFNSDDYILRIGTGDEYAFLTVNCNDMSKGELSTLTVGDGVTAVGKFKDGGDLGVELKKCKLG